MDAFFNKRIEGPFTDTFKGYNQFLVSGGVDDLFLMDVEGVPRLCKIAEAYRQFGHKVGYELVITVKSDLTLEFPTDAMRALYDQLASGRSDKLVDPAHASKAKQFVPKNRPPTQDAAPARPQGDAAQQQGRRIEEVKEQVEGWDTLNELSRIRRVLKSKHEDGSPYKVLVIFPEADKLVPLADADGTVIKRLEMVTRGWRDIIQYAHPDSRTVLIVNPHRLKDFHNLERQISCYDHNIREITIEQPPIDEMRRWLQMYQLLNAISGTYREAERVVLTGKANAGGNLQNFVSWVQGFYQKNPKVKTWRVLLDSENLEAVESKEELIEELDRMIGLKEVKEEIHKIVADAERDSMAAARNAYHMFFLGNPGSGKTVVANIVAKLFWAMELRTNRKVVEATIQDIVSQYNEGDTLQKMKDKVKEAMGGVLFIDEAYLFAESEWGRKAFQTLLTEMENNRKNLTVILAGYEERLQALKDVNPGIDSRIPIKLHFADYSKEEKLAIFKLHLDRENRDRKVRLSLRQDTEEKLLRVLDGCEGNGRGVRNVLERTLKDIGNAEVILPEHITDPHQIHPDKADEVLQEIDREFIGMQPLKDRLRAYFRRVEYTLERTRRLGLTKRSGVAYRIRFTGPPGTGKTSIARYMGKFFHAMGITETDQFIECGATSLKGAYIGHAQQAVNNLFHDNRGKVIFIDEIYSLYNPDAHQDDSFSREVIDTLVRCLTAQEYQNTVVIVAGYKDRVDKFMEANPGLASRIPEEIEFVNYSADDCVAIFRAAAQSNSYVVQDACDDKLKAYFSMLLRQKDFGNARDVKAFLGAVESRIIDRLVEKDANERTDDDYRNIMPEDIPSVETSVTPNNGEVK